MKKILLFLLFTNAFYSQTLDTTFDGDGILNNQISNSPTNQVIFDGLVQSDGKLVVCGNHTQPITNGIVARFNTDGSKDRTFNSCGFKSYGATAYQTITQLSDGKYLVAGKNLITKLNSDGTLDTSFNTNGGVNIIIANMIMNIKKISVQTDNKIVASGYISNGTDTDFIVVRLNSDGSYDNSFNSVGYNIIPVGGVNNAFAHQIQPDGKIVVVGEVAINGSYDFCIARLNNNGLLDTSFGNMGIAVTPFGGGASRDQARNVRILPDGKLFVVGASQGYLAFAQYNPDGTLDTTYNSNGTYISPFTITYSTTSSTTSYHIMPKIAVDANGKTLIGFTSNNDFKVLRLLNDGITLDSSFSGGVITQNSNNDALTYLGIKSNGRIITGGYSSNSSISTNNTDASIKMLELNTNGSLYSSNTKELITSLDNASFTTISPIDQSIFTLSKSMINGSSTMAVSKLLSNGVIDTSFGTNGVFSFIGAEEPIAKIIVLADGKLIILGGSFNSIYKLNSNGTLDTTFGVGGDLDLTTIDPNIAYVDTIILSNDNKFLVGVDYNNTFGSTDNGIIKLNQDGTLDTSFGINGVASFRFNPDTNLYDEFPISMVTENNGGITLTSVSIQKASLFTSNTKINLARLNNNGELDVTFGTGGKLIYDFGQGLHPTSLMKNSTNNYLIHFKVYTNNVLTSSKTLNINDNGTINTGYGVNGVANDVANSINYNMVLQNDNKLIKVGKKNNQFCTSRYLPTGAIDTSYGINGEKNESLGGISSKFFDVNILPEGKILATGESFNGDEQVLTFVKYTNLTLGSLDFALDNKSLLVYPNPIENIATFQYTLNEQEEISINLIDINGNIIKNIEEQSTKSAGDYKIELNLENLHSGVYFLRIDTRSKGNQTVKVIKK